MIAAAQPHVNNDPEILFRNFKGVNDMPYSERVAEAFIDAKDSPNKQDRLVREGQFDKDPVTGESYSQPKYRLPTAEEAKDTSSAIKSFGTGLAGTLAIPMGPIAGGVFSAIANSTLEGLSPRIERWVESTPSVPVYENWTESDFWNAYQGS